MIDQYLKGQSYFGRWYFTLIFIVASILMITKLKHIVYNIFDYIFCIIFILTSPMGDISAIPFLFLIIFDIKNTKKMIITATIIILSLCISFIFNKWSLQNTFAIFSLYALMSIKYYYIIHKPTVELKSLITFKQTIIDQLTTKLEILGTPEYLTDSQIISRYGFLKYTGENGDNPYRKLNDIRKLSEGQSNKSIALDNCVTELHQSNVFGIIKEHLRPYNCDEGVLNNTHLIKLCIELGIIQVNIRV